MPFREYPALERGLELKLTSTVLKMAEVAVHSVIRQFPVAALTKNHQRGDLKQQKFILSWFWRPEVKASCQEAHTPWTGL